MVRPNVLYWLPNLKQLIYRKVFMQFKNAFKVVQRSRKRKNVEKIMIFGVYKLPCAPLNQFFSNMICMHNT